jgi:hypothetical protein
MIDVRKQRRTDATVFNVSMQSRHFKFLHFSCAGREIGRLTPPTQMKAGTKYTRITYNVSV